MVWAIFWVGGYLVIGGLSGGVASYVTRLDYNDDRMMWTLVSCFFWPLAWIGCLVVAAGWAALQACERVGGTIGRTRHKHAIAAQTIAMMEADLARSGNQELALRWDYLACPKCYGSGCGKCSNEGVVRERIR